MSALEGQSADFLFVFAEHLVVALSWQPARARKTRQKFQLFQISVSAKNQSNLVNWIS